MYTVRKVDGVVDKRLLKRLQKGLIEAEYYPTHLPELDTHWWVAYLEDKPVGFAGLRIMTETLLKTGYEPFKYGYLCRAGVHKKHQGHGLQKQLIQHRVDYAKDRGCLTCVTYTTHDNCPSMNSLISKGFKTYRPEELWGGPEQVYFRLDFIQDRDRFTAPDVSN